MAILFPVMAATLVVGFLLPAMCLWLGGRWLGAPKATLGRALLVVVCLSLLCLLSLFMVREFASDYQRTLIVEGVLLIVQMFVICLVIRSAFDITLNRAFLVWLIGLVPSLALNIGMVLLLNTFVMNAYVVPTNAMAPTVIGWHRVATCPRCQGILIVPAPDPKEPPFPDRGDEDCICTTCRKMSIQKVPKSPVSGPDRILVSYLTKPKRWDIVTFRSPQHPSVLWIKRLVGLPQEKVVIKDGAVWINDVKMDVPAELGGLDYLSENDPNMKLKASPDEPMQLGANEYCVLGDFTQRSNDSRYWGPLPGGNIKAVVTACYWPMSRWRIFR